MTTALVAFLITLGVTLAGAVGFLVRLGVRFGTLQTQHDGHGARLTALEGKAEATRADVAGLREQVAVMRGIDAALKAADDTGRYRALAPPQPPPAPAAVAAVSLPERPSALQRAVHKDVAALVLEMRRELGELAPQTVKAAVVAVLRDAQRGGTSLPAPGQRAALATDFIERTAEAVAQRVDLGKDAQVAEIVRTKLWAAVEIGGDGAKRGPR